MNPINILLRALGLPTHSQATRDDEGRVIIDPEAHGRIHVTKNASAPN